MIKLELTESEYKNLLLKYELGKLVESNIIEAEVAEIHANSELDQKICKSGVDGGSEVVIAKTNKYEVSESLESEVDHIYDSFVEYILSGNFAKEMEGMLKEMEEMKKDDDLKKS